MILVCTFKSEALPKMRTTNPRLEYSKVSGLSFAAFGKFHLPASTVR